MRKRYPDISDDKIESIVMEVFEDNKKNPPVVLNSYNRESIAGYLTEEFDMGSEEAQKFVSRCFDAVDSAFKEKGYNITISEEEKAKLTMALFEGGKYLARLTSKF